MRKKQRYTEEEVTKNLYTFGKEFMTSDNEEYIGLYHTYRTGEIYTEKEWDEYKSKKLIPYIELSNAKREYIKLKDNIKTKYNAPIRYYPRVDQTTQKQNFINRYFISKVNDYEIIEIDKHQYDLYQRKLLDTNLYSAVMLKWYIAGNINDMPMKPGVVSKNEMSVKVAEDTIPNLSKYLTNLTEFHLDLEFKVPKSINDSL